MPFRVENMKDESLQREIIKRFEEIKKNAKRMNEIGTEMVNRGIIAGYEKMYYPNIWNHGQREVTE